MNIRISNLPPDTTEEELEKLFAKFGKVKSVNVFKYPNTSKGYGFIDAPAPADTNRINKNKIEVLSIDKQCREN